SFVLADARLAQARPFGQFPLREPRRLPELPQLPTVEGTLGEDFHERTAQSIRKLRCRLRVRLAHTSLQVPNRRLSDARTPRQLVLRPVLAGAEFLEVHRRRFYWTRQVAYPSGV